MKEKYITLAVAASIMLTSCGLIRSTDTVRDTDTSTSTEASTTVGSEETAVTTDKTSDTEAEAPDTAPVTETTHTETTAATTAPVITEEPVPTVTATTAEPPPVETSQTPPAEPVTGGTTSKGYTVTERDGITYVDGVLIANKTYGLPDTYNPGGLTPETYAAFVQMQSAASAEGYYIYVRSGFRSYWDQNYIYNGYAATDGVENADRYSARAGHSEHQSGMAIDVNETTYAFGESAEGIWLRENCHLYGFILRYPRDKEEVTGYMYEPWHIRYVGVELAQAITDSGLCLEEYFGISSAYTDQHLS